MYLVAALTATNLTSSFLSTIATKLPYNQDKVPVVLLYQFLTL